MQFGILGPVEVWLGDERLTLGGRRQLALLAFLILHANQAVSSDALIEGVWGTVGAGGDKRLSMAIARLRRGLEPRGRDGVPVLRTLSGGYMLSIAPGELDAERFETLVREGLSRLDSGAPADAGARLREALALWRGPALADVGFEDFAQAEIHRLEESRLVALEARIDADLQLGADAGLAGELGSLLARHPTREHLAGQLMLALYQAGRQAEALEAYQRTRAYLLSELGLEPGPALKALQVQILEQSPAIEPHTARDRATALGRPLPEAVTMVIAAVEGAASLQQGLGDLYRDIERGCDELSREICARRGAVEVAERAHGLLAVFSSPRMALDAALEVCDATASVEWPGGATVRLQVGVHTGRLRISSGGFWGEDVHYTARLADAAHGGQVLVSAVTAALTPDAVMTDVGEHRLGDFPIPRRLFALGTGPHRIPRTGDPLRSNLPVPHGQLIGRDGERAELVMALRDAGSRLLTVTGPGGSGKTRLALAVAGALVDVLPDGAFFVALGQIGEPEAVAATIAARMGIHLPAGGDPAEALGLALSERELLLVLDNFEHLLDAGPLIAGLLARAPHLRVMITSQAPLRIRGERVHALGPLELPAADDQTSVATSAAGRLLVERVREVDPSFEPSPENAGSLARLCRALGGLPLAIELAAARLAVVSPDELLARLAAGIDAIGHGTRDLPARQRGLRAALDWTHALLNEDEAILLRRLGVFAGPVSLDRIERVCGGSGDLLEALAQLVDLSLVTRAGDGRFLLHAAVQGYAREQLAHAGESNELARRHADAFADAAEGWGSRFLFEVGKVQSAVLREEADIAQALIWAAAADQIGFARLAGGAAMTFLWAGRLPPWSEMIERALAGNGIAGRPRAWLLLAASLAALQREDVQLARARLVSTIAAAEDAADPPLACLMQACSIIFNVLTGATDGIREEHSLLSERVAELGDGELVVLVNGLEPYVLGYCEQRYGEAGAIWAELVADGARTDFAAWTAQYCWPDCPLLEGDYIAALGGFRLALRAARECAQVTTVAYQIEGIAMALGGLGRHADTLTAIGWADSVRQTAGPAINSWYKQLLDAARRGATSALGAERARAAYARGRALTLDAAVNAALEIDRRTSPIS